MYGYDIFHEQIMENLIDSVRTDTARHAYIFEGARGVGAYEAAKLFAAALVCEKVHSSPCGVCQACVMAAADTHPDIVTIRPPEGKKNIPVDTIRTISADAYTKPYESRKKVYIIAYGDEMNEQAQNAFLKLLEEPPEYAVFIILAENHESLLETVRSRCIQIRFGPVIPDKIKAWLKKRHPELGNDDFYITYAGGIPQKAELILQDESFLPLRNSAFDMLDKLISSQLSDAYKISDYLEENKDNADVILDFWQSFTRDIMLIQNSAEAHAANKDFAEKLRRFANEYSETRIACALEEIITAQKMRRRYVSLHTIALKTAFTIKRKG